MRVLTLKTQTAAKIKIPGYPEYTIKFKYYFQWIFRSIREKQVHETRTTRTYIIYILEISIDMNRECARFARSIMSSGATTTNYVSVEIRSVWGSLTH